MIPSLQLPAAPRILIVRLSALGDLVFAGSLLDPLRQRWPQAQIHWLVARRFAGLLEADSRIDRLFRIDDQRLGHLDSWRQLRRELASERYDLVLDVQGLVKSRLLARLAPASLRIGFQSKEPLGFLLDAVHPKGGDNADFGSEYRQLASDVCALPKVAANRLQPTAERLQAQAVRLADWGLPAGFVACCPFTTRPQKHWVDAHWVALAQQLHAAGAPPLAILGGPAEREAAAALVARFPPGSVNLAGDTRLQDLPALLSHAALVIGVDTGLTHIGIALRRPTLALFGSTLPYQRGAEDGRFSLLYDALPCSPCRRRPSCNGAFTCMRQLSPERACAAALALLRS